MSVWSLSRQLSVWLAIQGLLATVAVSAAVYLVNDAVLKDRQRDELQLKREVVRHALAETAATGDLTELRHKLRDFLAGHDDMALSLTTPSGRSVFDSGPAGRHGTLPQFETVRWQESWPAPAPEQVDIVLRLDVSKDTRLLRRLGAALLAASLVAAGIVSVTGFLLVRRGLRPVRALSAQIDALSLNRSRLRLDDSAQPLELRPLVEHFNALLMRVERAYVQLEGFNADVAHELRTPLTTLIGSSELALHRERPAEELAEVIAGNLEDLRRLSAIVNDMLFLSHADRGAAARRQPVDSLAEALADILDYHEAALLERGLQAVCKGDAIGHFDTGLLRRALSNLLGNATRYARTGSVVQVHIVAVRQGSCVRISVVNYGDAISADHLPRLFDRFYRADRSRSADGANHGLGLAIVAAIARMHGGEPFAESTAGQTKVGIEIPATTRN